MEEIKVSPIKLKQLIDRERLVGEGYYGSVFTYQDRLIKLDKTLYNLLKNHDINESERMVYYRYIAGRENFNDPNQIEKLVSIQNKVKLTKFPTGIVTLDGVDYQNTGMCIGIIIPYLKRHKMLENLRKDNLPRVIKILKHLLLIVRELEENKIFQQDLYHLDGKGGTCYNIMYKGSTPQLIDMSGKYVIIDGNKTDRISMYDELGQVIIDFLDFNKIVPPYNRWYTDDYGKNVELVKKLERSIK